MNLRTIAFLLALLGLTTAAGGCSIDPGPVTAAVAGSVAFG